MTFKFYKNISDNNTVLKNIQDEKIVYLSFKTIPDASLSQISMKIRVKMDKSLLSYNYCKIEEFGKYYYITDISVLNNRIMEIVLEVDVLMTYWDEFKDNDAIIDRAATVYNLFLNDPSLPMESGTIIRRYVTKETPFDPNNGSLILLATGPGPVST